MRLTEGQRLALEGLPARWACSYTCYELERLEILGAL